MTFWNAQHLREVAEGTWLVIPTGSGDLGPGLSTDTRTIVTGQVFCALRGQHFDAHDFLDAAIRAGASMLIVDRPEAVTSKLHAPDSNVCILHVDCTLAALGRLAAAYRNALDPICVIAVCGSNGKTTTTRLIHSVLSTTMPGSASPRSFNNDIGLPLTILRAKPGDAYVVCEMGTNAPGEIEALARIARPDIAVITSVGRAHMENFASVNEVAREDASALKYLRTGGIAVIPALEPVLADAVESGPPAVTFGHASSANLQLSKVEHDDIAPGQTGLRFKVNGTARFAVPLLGEHNALNALAAIAVARHLGLDDTQIAEGLMQVQPADLRLNQLSIAGVDLLVDCYNANPESAIAGVRTFAALSNSAQRRVLILGDMLELGRLAAPAHEELARLIEHECPADVVVTVGTHARAIAEHLRVAWPHAIIKMFDALGNGEPSEIASMLRRGDAVFLKGSRGIGLERIVNALRQQHSKPSVAGAASIV